jgi:SAM-dependent MidA family methyltransferase
MNVEWIDDPMLLLGHEFLDALPVHQFQFHNGHWLERLVDVDTDDGYDSGQYYAKKYL